MPRLLIKDRNTHLWMDIFASNDYIGIDEIRVRVKNDEINYEYWNEVLDDNDVEDFVKYLDNLLKGKIEKNYSICLGYPEIVITHFLPSKDENGNEKDLTLQIEIGYDLEEGYDFDDWLSFTLDRVEIEEFYYQLFEEVEKIKKESRYNKNYNYTYYYPSAFQLKNEKENINKKIEEAYKKVKIQEQQNDSHDKKYRCVRARYNEFYGKEYTFFVDEFYVDGHWFVEDTEQEVFLTDLVLLTEEELPVNLERMKRLVHKES